MSNAFNSRKAKVVLFLAVFFLAALPAFSQQIIGYASYGITMSMGDEFVLPASAGSGGGGGLPPPYLDENSRDRGGSTFTGGMMVIGKYSPTFSFGYDSFLNDMYFGGGFVFYNRVYGGFIMNYGVQRTEYHYAQSWGSGWGWQQSDYREDCLIPTLVAGYDMGFVNFHAQLAYYHGLGIKNEYMGYETTIREGGARGIRISIAAGFNFGAGPGVVYE